MTLIPNSSSAGSEKISEYSNTLKAIFIIISIGGA